MKYGVKLLFWVFWWESDQRVSVAPLYMQRCTENACLISVRELSTFTCYDVHHWEFRSNPVISSTLI